MKTKTLFLITVVLGFLILFTKYPNLQIPRPGEEQYFGGFSHLEFEPAPENSFEDAIGAISKEELKEDLYYLASDELEGRKTGEPGNVKAAEFIKKKLKEYGLQVEYQPFTANGRSTNNVIGWLDGENPNEIVVVGAHFDHIGKRGGQVCNGADDNASGTVAVMQIAKAFAMLKGDLKRTVVFQLYSGEEMGLLGSRYYCNNPTFPRENPDIKKHIFMLNLDMVGYLDRKTTYFALAYADTSFDLRKIRAELQEKYPFAGGITKTGGGGSDHASFSNKGIPTLWLFTGSHSNYHQPTDTAEKINYAGLEDITKYGFEILWKVTQSEAAPVFNKEGYHKLRIKNDHDNPNWPFPFQY